MPALTAGIRTFACKSASQLFEGYSCFCLSRADPDYDDTAQASYDEASDAEYDEAAQPDYDTDFADPDSGEAPSQEYYKRSQK